MIAKAISTWCWASAATPTVRTRSTTPRCRSSSRTASARPRYIQRKLAIGYNKAARLVEQMEDEGLVSPANHVGKREILVPEPQ